jgi:L-2-hydroxyglutarate oxidase
VIYDYCVIGGGIVGLATALKLLEMRPGASLLLLEKEDRVAAHQTGHNSGVIHAGIYYAPGSLKAKLCAAGEKATKRFCLEHGIPYETCGKLIVATSDAEMKRLAELYERAAANGIRLERISGSELRDVEPNVTGKGALLSPGTAIVDYAKVAEAMARGIVRAGGEMRLRRTVESIEVGGSTVTVGSPDGSWTARVLVVCAGLQSDRMARLAGATADFRILPFRGEYFRLPASKNGIVKHLIYPAPDPALPFLGIHLTRMIDGSVTVGPNAVLGLAREGYPKLSANARDAWELLTYGGFWKLALRNRRHVAEELCNSLSKRRYLEKCRAYCPDLTIDDLLPHSAGIRAQAVTCGGEMIHDFLFAQTSRSLHVCNAPSPAATSAIPIGEAVARRCLQSFGPNPKTH